jgi:hypothetical protein
VRSTIEPRGALKSPATIIGRSRGCASAASASACPRRSAMLARHAPTTRSDSPSASCHARRGEMKCAVTTSTSMPRASTMQRT